MGHRASDQEKLSTKLLRQLVPTPVRLLAARILPLPSRLDIPTVTDVHSYRVCEGFFVHVYWLIEPTGPALGASIVVFNDEVMRFDCVGEGAGHMHLNIKRTRGFPGEVARLYYREATIDEQIERSCFEFEHNLSYAMKTNVSGRIRRMQLRADEMQNAVSFLRDSMIALLNLHRSELPARLADSPPVGDSPPEVPDPRLETTTT